MQRIFPRALVACIAEARLPRADEIEIMAAKIWREAFAHRNGRKWSEVSRASAEHGCVMAAVAAALGCEDTHLNGFTRQLAA